MWMHFARRFIAAAIVFAIAGGTPLHLQAGAQPCPKVMAMSLSGDPEATAAAADGSDMNGAGMKMNQMASCQQHCASPVFAEHGEIPLKGTVPPRVKPSALDYLTHNFPILDPAPPKVRPIA